MFAGDESRSETNARLRNRRKTVVAHGLEALDDAWDDFLVAALLSGIVAYSFLILVTAPVSLFVVGWWRWRNANRMKRAGIDRPPEPDRGPGTA